MRFTRAIPPLRQGSYRGLAATANHDVRETHMDEIARALNVDAVEFRLRHLKDERMRAVLTTAAQKSGWPKPSVAGRAVGISCGTEKGSYVATAAEVSKAPNGFKVERLVVVFECGAIVNPDGLHNQVEGAVVQGLGGALFEAVEFANGAITNGTMEQDPGPTFQGRPADSRSFCSIGRTSYPRARERRRSSAWLRRSAARSAHSQSRDGVAGAIGVTLLATSSSSQESDCRDLRLLLRGDSNLDAGIVGKP